jgi:hypothetical protein
LWEGRHRSTILDSENENSVSVAVLRIADQFFGDFRVRQIYCP